tara:strand:+ start:2058 stop:2207 length:150 start_codon:yes stop_codon:yes gene_type:complete
MKGMEMCEIKVEIHLENFIDRYSFTKKEIQEPEIRKYSVQAIYPSLKMK